jgi:hypothetical protein
MGGPRVPGRRSGGAYRLLSHPLPLAYTDLSRTMRMQRISERSCEVRLSASVGQELDLGSA